MSMLRLKSDDHVSLEERADGTRRVHVFDEDSILAVNMAWSAERPLLVRGEPGVGKSQLAEAVAKHGNWKFIPFVVDSQTEARDLLWQFDAVKRLADAQMLGAVGDVARGANETDTQQLDKVHDYVNDHLTEGRYVMPGPLWWAFNWQTAEDQNKKSDAKSPYPNSPGDPANGCVVLVDEIDKGDTAVPNGLLGALGGTEIQPFGIDQPVRAGEKRPLIIITTNEERNLPDAFVRRCIVHVMEVPDGKPEALSTYLIERGSLHFPKVSREVLEVAAELLCRDREDAKRHRLKPYPGQAEYLDLIRAVYRQESQADEQIALLRRISKFALKKFRGASV